MQSKISSALALRICLIMFLFFVNLNISESQQDFSLDTVSKKTKELYDSKKWNELISYSNLALKNNVDFYSLRSRLGTAYYKTGKFLYAIPHFEKALNDGYEDLEVMKYLYYSYFYSDRTEECNYIFSKFPQSIKDKIRPANNSFINDINAESVFAFSNDNNKNGNTDLDGTQNIYGEQTLNGNEFLFTAGLTQMPLDILGIYYDYSYLNQKKTKQIQIDGNKISDNYNQIQNRFYNRIDIYAGNGFVISPAGQYVGISYTTVYASPDSVISDYTYNNSGKNSFTLSDKQTVLDNFVLSLNLTKYISVFKLGLNGCYSYLNGFHQTQTGISVKAFPSGGVKLYTKTDAALQFQNSITNLIVTQTFGGRFNKNLSTDLFATFGKINNFSEQNGYLVYNNNDNITFKTGAEINYFLSGLNIYLMYEYQQREKNYYYYDSYSFINSSLITKQSSYQLNSILAGIKYTF